ncbi:MAG: monovalent cation/H(+) antiporter subunit G, partial [Betaproteobacteria bacterium]
MLNAVPPWVEALVALLLLAIGALAVTAALGLERLRNVFERMHPPAVATTLATALMTAPRLCTFRRSN